MCLPIGWGLFPRPDVLDDLPSLSRALFGRKRLGTGDAEALPVDAGIKIMLAQVARRQLFEGFAADEACNRVYFDAFFPV